MAGRWSGLLRSGFGPPDFRRLAAASSFSGAGMSGEQVILGLLVYRITDSSAWVGTSLAAYYLPLFIAGTLAGAAADRFDRRTLIRGLEICHCVALAAVAGVIAAGLGTLAMMMAISVVLGSLRASTQPLRVSYVYDLFGRTAIVSALGRINLAVRFGHLVGALAAGRITEAAGADAAFLVLAAGHAVAWLLVCRLRSAGQASVSPSERVPIRRNLAEYLNELAVNRTLTMLVLLTAAVELFGFSFQTGVPELAADRLELGADGLGDLNAARAAGGVAASLVLSAGLGPLHRPGRLYIGVILVFGLGMILLGSADSFLWALAALFLVSAMATASDVLTQSMVQMSVPNALRGRAMGAWSLAIGISPLGHIEMGLLIGALGLAGAYAANGAVLILLSVGIALCLPALRRL